MEKILIIPVVSIMDISQISAGVDSMYDVFRDRWDLIGEYVQALINIKKLI